MLTSSIAFSVDDDAPPFVPGPPHVSALRLHQLARDRRAEAAGLERHLSPYQDASDRLTEVAQHFVAWRASVLRSEASELERQAKEVAHAVGISPS